MATNFFGSKEGDGGVGVTLTLATLALSFLVRPLGGIILGPLGDKVGRQKVMVLTVILMTLASGSGPPSRFLWLIPGVWNHRRIHSRGNSMHRPREHRRRTRNA
ncbi:MAG: hypothetical protein ABIQ22_00155 [Arthrobacter oryzae]